MNTTYRYNRYLELMTGPVTGTCCYELLALLTALIITARKRSCGKVMFSQVSVNLFTVGRWG